MSVKLHWTNCLSPLNDEKREVMINLLENVQTSRLKNAFEKYLPAVLSEDKRQLKKPRHLLNKLVTKLR